MACLHVRTSHRCIEGKPILALLRAKMGINNHSLSALRRAQKLMYRGNVSLPFSQLRFRLGSEDEGGKRPNGNAARLLQRGGKAVICALCFGPMPSHEFLRHRSSNHKARLRYPCEKHAFRTSCMCQMPLS